MNQQKPKRYFKTLVGAIGITVFSLNNANAVDYTGPPITFEQVYANPDDQDLNLNYARQQASQGDYLSAAASLERMLYATPNWGTARLFLAICLYHLDDLQAAGREPVSYTHLTLPTIYSV